LLDLSYCKSVHSTQSPLQVSLVNAVIISSTSEFIPQSQVLPSQVIPNIDQGAQVLSSQVLPTQVLPTIDHGVQVLPSEVLPNIDQGFLP
jgi:hypothetical protein